MISLPPPPFSFSFLYEYIYFLCFCLRCLPLLLLIVISDAACHLPPLPRALMLLRCRLRRHTPLRFAEMRCAMILIYQCRRRR